MKDLGDESKKTENLNNLLESYVTSCILRNIITSFNRMGLYFRITDAAIAKTSFEPSRETEYIKYFRLENELGNFVKHGSRSFNR